ncbi:MAG: glycoside hydrolase family 2, partial [Chloroflexota bacterium]|nr:glycoside hydrolase family 2 [Chloroflexota bacterium]
ALYRVTATLVVSGEAVDELSATCGFRTVEGRDGRIYLNGAPIYLRGVLDQAYYPETIYTPPSLEFLEDQVRKAKALGLNCLRCHIKIEDPRYYEVADRLGILIWTEIPNWVLLTPATSARVKATFRQMVERDWNHPSIFAWTLVNENWGTDLKRNPAHRQWLADFYHEAKVIDPTRLIVDNSACNGNFHVAGDIEDFHEYRAIPDHAAEWDEWVAEFAGRESDWVWAKDFAHERRADLPLIVSEFGNWGLPDPANIQEHGADPWWFENGHEWGDGIVYPHGMKERFDFWQLGNVFGSFETFTEQSQGHMARSLAYEIGSMRLHAAIGGYVITEFTDVHWECNGLLDMQRNVKHGLDTQFVPINQDQVVVARPHGWSGRPGTSVAVDIQAFDVDDKAGYGRLHWQAGAASGDIAAPGGIVQIPLTAVGIETLQVRWLAADETGLASHAVELACLLPPLPERKVRVLDDSALASVLTHLGYNVVSGGRPSRSQGDTLLVTRRYTKELQTAVQAGAQVLLLAGSDFAQNKRNIRLPGGGVLARKGTIWQGDWATSFSWLKKTGPFAHLPGGPLLEMEYADIMPDAVIVGLPAWLTREQSWAGLALGWIHKPVSLLAKLPYGNGALTVTTFNLTAALLEQNVIAQGLMSGLVTL